MKLTLTLGAIERFEDASGTGLLALVEGRDLHYIRAQWTVRRLRLLAECAGPEGTTAADIEAWLDPSQLVVAQMDAISQVIEALTPPPEADEHFDAGEGGESEGNSESGAG